MTRIAFPGIIVAGNGLYDYEFGTVSATGTVAVTNLYPGNAGPYQANSSMPIYFTHLGSNASNAIFVATDATHGRELWITDGTVAGTTFLKDINVTNPTATNSAFDTNSPNPSSNFAAPSKALNGVIYFGAADAVSGQNVELWKTDGTAGGTQKVAEINASATVGGYPYAFTAVGNTMYFVAADATHGSELWKTDGSPGGTAMVLDIRTGGGSYNSSNPYRLTAVGNTLYFVADDGTHGGELWKSDAGGTSMVKDINTTAVQNNPNNQSSSPNAFTAIGNILYFSASDGSAHGTELWRSDGSPGGTSMVKNINTHTQQGNSYEDGSNIQNMVNYNGTLLFFADDGVHGSELWRSDGTGGGTSLVLDINPVETYGGTVGSDGRNLTVAGSWAYFTATDGIHGNELWKTDGTAGGTSMVLNTNPYGSSSPMNLMAQDGFLYYTAYDGATGNQPQYSLYRTNGTTTSLLASHDYNQGSGFNNFVVFSSSNIKDYNADGNPDILLQNTSGQAALWFMNGTVVGVGSGNAGINPGASWKITGSRDFNGDGITDIVLQNTDGTAAIWFMNGTTVSAGSGAIPINPGVSWSLVGTGDFNGDGASDILLQNTNGQAAMWFMSGTSFLPGSGNAGINPGAAWKIAGTGDFNGDGKSDVILQNTDGSVAIWFMNGTTVMAGSGNVAVNPGSAWKVTGTADFNGDGKSDVLLQNTSGQVAMWFMNGTTVMAGSGNAGINPGSDWKVAGTGDFNADGHADIVLQNGTSGQPAIWFMNGTSVLSGSGNTNINPGSAWHVLAGTGG